MEIWDRQRLWERNWNAEEGMLVAEGILRIGELLFRKWRWRWELDEGGGGSRMVVGRLRRWMRLGMMLSEEILLLEVKSWRVWVTGEVVERDLGRGMWCLVRKPTLDQI